MQDYIRNLRRLIGSTKIIVPGVRALIFDDRNRLLLEKQALFPSWALPAGCIDVGESAYDAVQREVREETGITIRKASLFGLYTDPKYSVTYPNGDEVQTFTVAFLVREWDGVLRADNDEVVELGFFPLDALPEPIYPIHLDTIEDFRNHTGEVILK
jgi:8-oxo-dGTP pyrophosphatase MutT (NUDIX family)